MLFGFKIKIIFNVSNSRATYNILHNIVGGYQMLYKMAAKMVSIVQTKWKHNKQQYWRILFGFIGFIRNMYSTPIAKVNMKKTIKKFCLVCVYWSQFPQIPRWKQHNLCLTRICPTFSFLSYSYWQLHTFYWQTMLLLMSYRNIWLIEVLILTATLINLFTTMIQIILLIKDQSPTQTHAHIKLKKTIQPSAHNDLLQ